MSAIGEPMAITDEVSHPLRLGPDFVRQGPQISLTIPAESSGQLSQLLKATSKTRGGPQWNQTIRGHVESDLEESVGTARLASCGFVHPPHLTRPCKPADGSRKTIPLVTYM